MDEGGYFVFGGHSDGVVLPGGGVPQALARGHGGVSHGRRGEEDAQVLDGAPQALRLHLTGSSQQSVTAPSAEMERVKMN